MKLAESSQKSFLEEEDAIKREEERANQIKSDITKELSVIKPQLDDAMQQLRSLKKNQIEEIKTMPNPPEMIKLTLEAVCLLLQIKPKKIRDPYNAGCYIYDYWFSSMQALGKPDEFLKRLLTFNKDEAPKSAVETIKQDRFLKNPDFTPKRIRKASKACEGMCKWVRVILIYDDVKNKVQPKVEELAKMEKYINELKEKVYFSL